MGPPSNRTGVLVRRGHLAQKESGESALRALRKAAVYWKPEETREKRRCRRGRVAFCTP